MALIEDTQAMISYMLKSYGEDTADNTAARADLLAWLQGAEQDIFAAAPWHWRQEEVSSFTFATAQQVYAMDDAYQDVLMIFNADGEQMLKTPWPIFNRYYRTTVQAAISGIPTRWAWCPRESPSPYKLQIAIWPVPATSPDHTTTRIIREKKCQTLTDAATSYSFVPHNYRMILVWKAMKALAIHEHKPDLLQGIQGEIDQYKGSLAQKERDFVEGLI